MQCGRPAPSFPLPPRGEGKRSRGSSTAHIQPKTPSPPSSVAATLHSRVPTGAKRITQHRHSLLRNGRPQRPPLLLLVAVFLAAILTAVFLAAVFLAAVFSAAFFAVLPAAGLPAAGLALLLPSERALALASPAAVSLCAAVFCAAVLCAAAPRPVTVSLAAGDSTGLAGSGG